MRLFHMVRCVRVKYPRLYNIYYLNNTAAVYGTTVTRLLPWTGLSLPGTRKGGVERAGYAVVCSHERNRWGSESVW